MRVEAGGPGLAWSDACELPLPVPCQLGKAQPVYALEGSIGYCGSLIQWLRDNLPLVKNAAESEAIASQVPAV
jgi:glycerol kinase